MKKVLFLQIKGYDVGGVWYFNETLAKALQSKGFEVLIVSLRNNPKKQDDFNKEKLPLYTINETDIWEITRKKEVLKPLVSLNFKTFIKTLKLYFKEHKKLQLDFLKLKDYIRNQKPDYIITSHYQILDGIPKEYYKRTIAMQHSSLKDVLNVPDNKNKLKKYSKKVFKMVWLSKETATLAAKKGFKNNYYMYNPVRFETTMKADVSKNKKLIALTRIENYQKRINLMLKIADEVLKKVPDWTFEIYGFGEFDSESAKILKSNKQIKFMGKTNEPAKVLMNSSINLNTSLFEGFSLTILEAYMCGIPTISFDFGESVNEEIIDSKTGYIIKDDNILEYKEKLINLMTNKDLLESFSNNAKDFASNFTISKITQKWLDLFRELENTLK